MDIKEISLTDESAQKVFKNEHCNISADLAGILARAIIESYKAELLKEVGEPVGYVFKDDATRNFYNSRIGSANEYGNYAQPLFTSDQVAAAIIKATKPLETSNSSLQDALNEALHKKQELRTQLAAAQEEIELLTERSATNEEYAANLVRELTKTQDQLAKANQLWQVAQGRCDGLEEKLANAEQRVAEWQPISTAPKDGTAILGCGGLYNAPKNGWFNTVCWWSGYAFVDDGGDVDYVTHWMPLPEAPHGTSS